MGAESSRLQVDIISRLPSDICGLIFTRLPVKDLLASKCVSKSWLTLISTLVSNQEFVQIHLNYHRHNSPSRLMFGSLVGYKLGTRIYSIGYESIVSSLLPLIGGFEEEDPLPKLTLFADGYVSEMDYPFRYSCLELEVDLFGSCDGIVCLWFHLDSYPEQFFCLWNPATKEYKKMSQAPQKYDYCNVQLYGFFYDPISSDYKFIIGVSLSCEEETTDGMSSLIYVYTLRSDSWTSFLTPHEFSWVPKSGILFNGELHWLTSVYSSIVSLDISTERFNSIQPPSEPSNILLVGVVENRLCVLAIDESGAFEIWKLQVYGDPNSWIKRWTVTHETITKRILTRITNLRFMWCFETGVVLFIAGNDLVLYDPEHGSVLEQRVLTHRSMESAENFSESIVLLNSGTYVGGRTTNSQNLKNRISALEERNAELQRKLHESINTVKGQKGVNHQYNTRIASKVARESTNFEDESFTVKQRAEKEGSKTHSTSKDSYPTMTVQSLRALLKGRGLMVKGKKDVLIARLREQDELIARLRDN